MEGRGAAHPMQPHGVQHLLVALGHHGGPLAAVLAAGVLPLGLDAWGAGAQQAGVRARPGCTADGQRHAAPGARGRPAPGDSLCRIRVVPCPQSPCCTTSAPTPPPPPCSPSRKRCRSEPGDRREGGMMLLYRLQGRARRQGVGGERGACSGRLKSSAGGRRLSRAQRPATCL